MSLHAEPPSPAEPGGAEDGYALPQSVDWAALVANIQNGEQKAMEQLYTVFGKGIRYYLTRQLGVQELEDKIHDTFVITINAIRRGELREPERLMGFVRTVVRRMVSASIHRLMDQRRDSAEVDEASATVDERLDPERELIRAQNVRLMEQVLQSIEPRDREILTRFYLHQQSAEEICRDMDLTSTQFRLLKSRAKARFGELGRRRLELRKNPQQIILRKAASA